MDEPGLQVPAHHGSSGDGRAARILHDAAEPAGGLRVEEETSHGETENPLCNRMAHERTSWKIVPGPVGAIITWRFRFDLLAEARFKLVSPQNRNVPHSRFA